MEYYLSTKIGSTLILSPFRKDENPTCGFYYSKRGRLYLHDFATSTHYDCIEVVKCKYGISFREAVDRIYRDRSQLKYSGGILKREDKFYEFLLGDMATFAYFHKFGISTETLIRYKVYPVKTVYLNEEMIAKTTKDNPIFAYIFKSGNTKFYRPLTKEKSKKWAGNSNATDIFGIDQLPRKGKLLLITSSGKDVMVLSELGYNAIAFNGEGYGAGKGDSPVDAIIADMKRRFEHVVFYMNNDKAGEAFNKTLSFKFRCKSIQNPINTPKDISDFVHSKSIYNGKRVIKKLLSKAFKEKDEFLAYSLSLSSNHATRVH